MILCQRSVDLDLARCRDLLARVRVAAVQRYGAAALDEIDLPALAETSLDAELVRVAAVLLWARHVEDAGLPRFVERMVEQVRSGRLLLPISAAGARLHGYWRGRSERLSYEERRELYGRLFGGPAGTAPNAEFDPLFHRLAAAIAEVGRSATTAGTGHLVARVNTAALDLGRSLTDRSAGIAAWAAEDIVRHIGQALDVLRDPKINAALGGRGPWHAIRLLGAEVLGVAIEPLASLSLAQAGREILTWIAEHAVAIEGSGVSLKRDDPVIAAAERWIAAREAP